MSECQAKIAPRCRGIFEERHHVIPRRDGGKWGDNILKVCSVCHSFIHHNEGMCLFLGLLKGGEANRPGSAKTVD